MDSAGRLTKRNDPRWKLPISFAASAISPRPMNDRSTSSKSASASGVRESRFFLVQEKGVANGVLQIRNEPTRCGLRDMHPLHRLNNTACLYKPFKRLKLAMIEFH